MSFIVQYNLLPTLNTMKRGIFISAIVIFTAFTAGYSKPVPVESETRNVADFTKVSFGVSGNLYINIGKEFKVTLEGSNSLLEDIVTEVNNGKLVIRKKIRSLNMNEKVTVYITMPEMKGLSVSGSGVAEIKDAVKTSDLDLSVSGSGKLYASDVTVSTMDCSISGSGDIIVGGRCNIDEADVSISGSGSYKGEAAEIGALGVAISGSGSCTCKVRETLRATVSGSGNITYLGDPRVDARISGSGRVRSR
jgi:hypothetical protein